MIVSRLYVIVDVGTLAARGVSIESMAASLRDAGVTTLQLRHKTGEPQEVLRNAALIRDVFAGGDCRLILNDRADLAVLAGWDGVHVGQGDLSPEDAKAVVLRTIPHPATMEPSRGWGTRRDLTSHPSQEREGWGTRDFWGGIVGVSTHTEEQVRVADAGCADYVAVGPVFATGTKLDAEAVVGLDGVRRARALTAKPLVAIGGITRENARSVIEAGADSVAVIGGLFVAGETIEKVARDFLDCLR